MSKMLNFMGYDCNSFLIYITFVVIVFFIRKYKHFVIACICSNNITEKIVFLQVNLCSWGLYDEENILAFNHIFHNG